MQQIYSNMTAATKKSLVIGEAVKAERMNRITSVLQFNVSLKLDYMGAV